MSPFETLRLRAEADIAARIKDSNTPQSRRPSWAPPLVLTGELLDICIKLELLNATDKPIARLWGRFANPKRVGVVLREANRDRDNAMIGVVCRGFELYAGAERGNRSAILLEAQRTADGNWRTGPWWCSPSRDPFHKVERAQREVDHWVPIVNSYSGKPEWENPLKEFTQVLEQAEQRLAAAEAEEQARYRKALDRYQLRCRATELAAARVVEFAGDQDVQMRFAARLCGHCCECFRTLTDPKSLEIGIGPECVQHVCWKSPEGGFVRMIDAIADGRIAAVDGALHWVAPPTISSYARRPQ
jgi:hypothetical protein